MIPLGGEQARQTRFWAKICLTQSPTKLLFQIAYNEDSLCETKSGCRAAKENSGNQEYSILLTDITTLNSFQAAKNTKFSHSNIFSGGNFARPNF
jgi:hypothetical protein